MVAKTTTNAHHRSGALGFQRTGPATPAEYGQHLGGDAAGIAVHFLPAVCEPRCPGELGGVVPPPVPERHLGDGVVQAAVEPDDQRHTGPLVAAVLPQRPAVHDDWTLPHRHREAVPLLDLGEVPVLQRGEHSVREEVDPALDGARRYRHGRRRSMAMRRCRTGTAPAPTDTTARVAAAGLTSAVARSITVSARVVLGGCASTAIAVNALLRCTRTPDVEVAWQL